MNLIKIFVATVAMLVLSACGSACWWPSRDNVPDTANVPAAEGAFGSLCAAPESGEEFCVSSDHDPADAWSQAAAKGPMPIQMWARWPSTVTLEELVESGDKPSNSSSLPRRRSGRTPIFSRPTARRSRT